MAWGRGGAGNIEAANQAITDDIESQRAQASSNTESSTAGANRRSVAAASPSTPANANQEYAHMGRGGAGNWYEPKELSRTGIFSSEPSSSSSRAPRGGEQRGEESVERTETRHRGRGGAGNYVWGAEGEGEAERDAAREEQMEFELKEMVAQDVEKGLARPGRAFVRPALVAEEEAGGVGGGRRL